MALLGTPDRAESFRHDGTRTTIWVFQRGQSPIIVWFDAEGRVKMSSSPV